MNKIYSNIKDRFITINNIVDFNKIKELANKDINIKETKNKKFLFVGRLDESSKRLSVLLETAKKCKNEKVNASFWIVGSGPDERLYKEFILDFSKSPRSYPYPAVPLPVGLKAHSQTSSGTPGKSWNNLQIRL